MTIGIIGYGQLSKALLSQKYVFDNLLYVVIRDEIKRNIANQKYPNTKIYSNISEIENFADLNLILTKDSNISEAVSSIINNQFLISVKNPNHIFAHCSGATIIDVLKPLSELGYPVVKAHPYQTFGFYNETNTDSLFQNVAWLCEVKQPDIKSKVDKTNKSKISEYITNINGKTIWKESITNFDEKYYHASSIFASNYLNSLIQIVKEFSKLSGIDANTFIYPIMRQTLENNFRIDDDDNDDEVVKTNFPISGPIARGDLETVKKQIEDIKLLNETTNASGIDFLKYYKEFGELTAYFCYTNGIFGVDKFEEFKKLFKES